jgi:hypothetical protein
MSTIRFLGARVVALAGILLAAGCATQAVDAVTTARSRTVGVAYALPDQVDFAHGGFTVFGNEDSKGDASGWHVDAAFLDSAKAALSGKYTVITAHVDPAAYDRLDGNFRFLKDTPSGAEVSAAFWGRVAAC